ncbi:MAG: hypothetical protein QXU20_01335 [Candidatus Woesearchaeota archaeon]
MTQKISKIIFNNHRGIKEEELDKFFNTSLKKNKNNEIIIINKFVSISQFFAYLNSDKIIFIEDSKKTALKDLKNVRRLSNEDKKILDLAIRAGRINVSFLGIKDLESEVEELLNIIKSI